MCVRVLRDAEVLSVFAAIINKLKALIEEAVPKVFEAVFEVTLQVGACVTLPCAFLECAQRRPHGLAHCTRSLVKLHFNASCGRMTNL